MKPLFWVALASGPAALLLWWVAGGAPAVVEAWYSRAVYPAVMAPWSRLVGLVPFPMAPLLVVLIVAGAIALFFLIGPGRALAIAAATVSVLVAWFVLVWGLNYQRQSWADTHGLQAAGGTVASLEALSVRLVPRVNALRETVGNAAWKTDYRAVAEAWERAGAMDPLLAGRYGVPKAFGAFDLLSWIGIAGICIPHTGEALVNPGPADWQLPFTAAHEAAHLRGWAREDEANFLAFWVLRSDPHPQLAYSAWGSALLYVANALEQAGPDGHAAWLKVLPTLDPRVREDWKASYAYWEKFQGPAAEVSRSVNDLYLKSQGQREGIKSYGRMVDLLLATSESSF